MVRVLYDYLLQMYQLMKDSILDVCLNFFGNLTGPRGSVVVS